MKKTQNQYLFSEIKYPFKTKDTKEKINNYKEYMMSEHWCILKKSKRIKKNVIVVVKQQGLFYTI